MPENHGACDDDKTEAVEMWQAEMKARKVRQEAISQADLDNAIMLITETLRTGWDTSGGRQLQRFVWSLWNSFHLIKVDYLSHALGAQLSNAVILLFRAAMWDVLTEAQKRRILTESGEFARWEECRAQTPEDENVLYPPPALSARELATLAVSALNREPRPMNSNSS